MADIVDTAMSAGCFNTLVTEQTGHLAISSASCQRF